MYKIQKKIWIFFLGCVFYGQHNLRGQLSEFPIQESLYPNGTLEEHFEVMWGKSLLMQNMKSGDSLGAATILLTNHQSYL